MKNIHIIPTDKASKLFYYDKHLGLARNLVKQNDGVNPQNIYITNDEEIKEGDWYFDVTLEQIIKANVNSDHNIYIGSCKKIILTTDQDLIKNGVQAIDDEFLEWFVKNPSCEGVEVQNDYLLWKHSNIEKLSDCYKIIILQEELKLINNCSKCGLDLVEREGSKPYCTDIDCGGIILSNETLREWALKEEPKQEWIYNNPQCKQIESCSKSLSKKCICPQEELCSFCKGTGESKYIDTNDDTIPFGVVDFDKYGKVSRCPDCNVEPKQETIEEAAENYYDIIAEKSSLYGRDEYIAYSQGVQDGVKFQQERMYSEEEMINFAKWSNRKEDKSKADLLKIWFNQFKKK